MSDDQLKFSPTGLIVKAATFAEFEGYLEAIVAKTAGGPWWIGDLLVWAEVAYADRYEQAVSAELAKKHGVTIDAIMQYQWVAKRVKADVRRQGVSWSHHRVVAALAPARQKKLLLKIEEEGWSVGALSAHIRDASAKPSDSFWLLVECKSEADRETLSGRMNAESRETRNKTARASKPKKIAKGKTAKTARGKGAKKAATRGKAAKTKRAGGTAKSAQKVKPLQGQGG